MVADGGELHRAERQRQLLGLAALLLLQLLRSLGLLLQLLLLVLLHLQLVGHAVVWLVVLDQAGVGV